MTTLHNQSVGLQDVLFHELHHRFFNSLQLLSATLGRLAVGNPCPDDMRMLQDRIAEAMGGSLNVASGRDYVVCVVVPSQRAGH